MKVMIVGIVLGLLVMLFAAVPVFADSNSDRPQNVRATYVGQALQPAVNIRWDAPTTNNLAVTGYVLYRRNKTEDGSWYVRKMLDVTNQFSDGQIENGSTYVYMVAALRDSKLSRKSNKATVTVTEPIEGPVDLAVGESIDGVLHDRSDKDWYRIELTGGQKYAIYVGGIDSGKSLGTPIITGLYNGEQERLGKCRNWHGNAGKYRNDAKAKFRAPYTGTFYVHVNSAGFASGTYWIRLQER